MIFCVCTVSAVEYIMVEKMFAGIFLWELFFFTDRENPHGSCTFCVELSKHI